MPASLLDDLRDIPDYRRDEGKRLILPRCLYAIRRHGRRGQDRHALGMNAIFSSSANRLPAALSAYAGSSGRSSTVDDLLPRFPAAWRVGCALGGTARGAARTAWAGGEPQRRRHRQPVAQVGRKDGCANGEADAVSYDAGKKVKGCSIHALTIPNTCP